MAGNDVDDFFGGYPSLKFPTLGTEHTITVSGVERSQQTDFDTGEPLFWDDGKPRYQLIITGQLDEEDWDDEEEDDDPDAGQRRLFVKSGMTKALGLALKRAKVKASQMPGGRLTMSYTDDGPKPKRGYPPKLYEADFVKGTAPASTEVDDVFDEPEEDEAPVRASRRSNGAAPTAKPARRAPADDDDEPETPARAKRAAPAARGSSARSGRARSQERSTQHQDEDAPDF